MLVAGVDVGSSSSKAVIVEDGRVRGWSVTPTGPDSAASAVTALDLALKECGLSRHELSYTVGTGYGRVNVPFAQAIVTEITCHARGCHSCFPQTRTILDMGGQDCKAIRCDQAGRVTGFAMNDKCAAGTGRYLERVAAAMDLRLEAVGPLSLEPAGEPLPVSDFCAVFAESDVIKLMREGKPSNDILAGAHEAATRRIRALLRRVGVEEALQISGGVAKNTGVVTRLGQQLGLRPLIAPEPQIMGALGAALLALDRASCGPAIPSRHSADAASMSDSRSV